MITMRLNSQVPQFGARTPGKRVFGLSPKMPIGAVGSPHFPDSANPKGAQSTKTHHLLWLIRQIRQASLTAVLNMQLNLCVNRRLRQSVSGQFSCPSRCFLTYQSMTRGGETSAVPMGNYRKIWEPI